MLESYKELIANQYEAVFCMLSACVNECPEAQWNATVANLKYCQAAFHALIFTDLYLGPDLESLRRQPFHRDHASVFADYEELEDRVQRLVYEQSFIKEYLQHCRDKAAAIVEIETVNSLGQLVKFGWIECTRAELHVSNIRHIQHHAAQLSLRLRLDTGEGVAWIGSSWRNS